MHRLKPLFRYAFGLALIVLGGFWVFGSSGDRAHRTPRDPVQPGRSPDAEPVRQHTRELVRTHPDMMPGAVGRRRRVIDPVDHRVIGQSPTAVTWSTAKPQVGDTTTRGPAVHLVRRAGGRSWGVEVVPRLLALPSGPNPFPGT